MINMTKQNYYKFLEYCAFLAENPNPCRNCARQEKVSCLWCNKRRTWSSESDKIIHDLDIDFDNKQIHEHLLNISKHSDLLEQLQEMKDRVETLERKIFDFERSVDIFDV